MQSHHSSCVVLQQVIKIMRDCAYLTPRHYSVLLSEIRRLWTRLGSHEYLPTDPKYRVYGLSEVLLTFEGIARQYMFDTYTMHPVLFNIIGGVGSHQNVRTLGTRYRADKAESDAETIWASFASAPVQESSVPGVVQGPKPQCPHCHADHFVAQWALTSHLFNRVCREDRNLLVIAETVRTVIMHL